MHRTRLTTPYCCLVPIAALPQMLQSTWQEKHCSERPDRILRSEAASKTKLAFAFPERDGQVLCQHATLTWQAIWWGKRLWGHRWHRLSPMVHGPRNLEDHVGANVFFSTMSILVEYKRPRNAAEDCAVLSPGYVLVEQVLSRELSRVWKVVHLRHSRDRTRVGPTGTELDIVLCSTAL